MFYGLGMQELLVILAIAMLLFGGKKLPEVGRNLGKAIRGFREAEDETRKELQKAAEGGEGTEKKDEDEDEVKKPDEETSDSGTEQTEETEVEKEEEGTGEEEADEETERLSD